MHWLIIMFQGFQRCTSNKINAYNPKKCLIQNRRCIMNAHFNLSGAGVFVCFNSLRPIQQFFSHVQMGLPMNHRVPHKYIAWYGENV